MKQCQGNLRVMFQLKQEKSNSNFVDENYVYEGKYNINKSTKSMHQCTSGLNQRNMLTLVLQIP